LNPEDFRAPARARNLLRQPRAFIAAGAALAVAAAAIAWALSGGGNSSTTTSAVGVEPIPPVELSAKGLRTLAKAVKQPIYWAGAKQGYMYELTRTENGNVIIRYLPANEKTGARGAFLTIATYPFAHAFDGLKNLADGRAQTVPHGGIALVDQNHATSIHLAYPRAAYQVEIYDPSAERALQLALSGDVVPVR
jgi:hypothetical protein